MADPGPAHGRFDVQPTASTHFSWINTRLAIERTFLSWLRTAISLIGFGFTIVQFFSRLQGMGTQRVVAPSAPRYFGLALIVTGIGALLVAIGQYHWAVSYLWGPQYRNVAGFERPQFHTPAYVCAFVLLLIGIVAFVSVFWRLP